MHCGAGFDLVIAPRRQRLDACETATAGELQIRARPQRTRRGVLRFTLGCDPGWNCEVTLALRSRSSTLARRTVTVVGGRSRRLRVYPARRVRRGEAIGIAVSGRATVPDTAITRSISGGSSVRLA